MLVRARRPDAVVRRRGCRHQGAERTAMTSTTPCPGCARPVCADGNARPPPWCPKCGASLRGPAEAPRPAEAPPPPAVQTAPGPAPAPAVAPAAAEACPGPVCFHGCAASFFGGHRLFRLYATATDLLVFRIGTGVVSGGQLVPRPPKRNNLPAFGLAAAVAKMQELEDT